MNAAGCFAPVRADNKKPFELAMQRLWLGGRLLPMGAHLTVQHVFRSAEEKPLEVVYAFALPRDAALRAFRITGPGFEVHSELKPTEDAVKAYESAIAQGSLAAVARQHGDGVINLTVGNIRPGETVTVLLELVAGVELRDGGFRFRFPLTLAPNYHPRMRAARIAPGVGELELPQDEFGDVLLPPYYADASQLHEVGFALTGPEGRAVKSIASTSHAIAVQMDDNGPAQVSLAPERDVPDRDLVLDVEFRETHPRVFAGKVDGGKLAFAAVIPSTAFGARQDAARRVAILLDRSGSMAGAPIAQARRAIEACLAVLSGDDQFGLVAFDDRVEWMSDALVAGTLDNRAIARQFLDGIGARGGTRLLDGFTKAARMLDGAGDVLILTDGQVSGTEAILSRAKPFGVRISCLGIGAASQDRFLTLLARETGGVSRFATPNERVDLAAVDLFASIGRPVATGLKTSGTVTVAPDPPTAVFSGTPVLLFGEAPGTKAELELTWHSGKLTLPLEENSASFAKTIHLLQGSRLITDWESRYSAREALAPPEKREESRVAGRLRSLSETYGLASREMALVAVVKRADDQTGDLPVTRIVPVGMPQGMPFGSIFGGFSGGFMGSDAGAPKLFERMASLSHPTAAARPAGAEPSEFMAMHSRGDEGDGILFSLMPRSEDDILMELAAQLEPDGGMPGNDGKQRMARSIALLYAMVAKGHSLTAGAFRSHVARLVEFLKSVSALDADEKRFVERAIDTASTGNAPPGDWLTMAQRGALSWEEMAKH